MSMTQDVREEFDHLERWILERFSRQYLTPHLKDPDLFELHIEGPKYTGGVLTVKIVSKRLDDNLRIIVHVDSITPFTDTLTGFRLGQLQNHAPGLTDECHIAHAVISRFRYPKMFSYVNGQSFLKEIVKTEYVVLSASDEAVKDDSDVVLLDESKKVLI